MPEEIEKERRKGRARAGNLGGWQGESQNRQKVGHFEATGRSRGGSINPFGDKSRNRGEEGKKRLS